MGMMKACCATALRLGRCGPWALLTRGAQNQEAVTLAQQSARPLSLSGALGYAAMFHQFRREVRCTQERAEAVMILA